LVRYETNLTNITESHRYKVIDGYLKAAGFEVTPLGLGCEPLGGTDWGHTDLVQASAAVGRAFDLGVRVFDTADVYGLGRSEIQLSKALGVNRHKATVITKFGVRWERNGNKKRAVTYKDASPAYLMKAAENSLRRLDLETIPVYLVHWPDQSTPIDDTLDALERLRVQGKIISYGLSNFDNKSIESLVQNYNVSAVELPYNLIERDKLELVSNVLESNNILSFSYGPLAQGLLTGKYTSDTKFDNSDRRHRLPHFSPQMWRRNKELLDSLESLGEKYNKTISQVALRWVLDSERVDSVIVGAKSCKQIEENYSVLEWKLSKEDILVLSIIQ
jgi:aryl-alcohol dehydrogenase-like predicted oxidoreductase